MPGTAPELDAAEKITDATVHADHLPRPHPAEAEPLPGGHLFGPIICVLWMLCATIISVAITGAVEYQADETPPGATTFGHAAAYVLIASCAYLICAAQAWIAATGPVRRMRAFSACLITAVAAGHAGALSYLLLHTPHVPTGARPAWLIDGVMTAVINPMLAATLLVTTYFAAGSGPGRRTLKGVCATLTAVTIAITAITLFAA